MSLNVGQIVYLKSNTSKKGVVVSVSDDNIISVFMDGEIQPFYETQLVINQIKNEIHYSTYNEFHSYMTSLEIQRNNQATLFSLNTGKIDFIPYQYRPVLKFIKADQPRLLIADSVGVGKTIEAELILKEYEARNDIDSIMIICPKPLITEKKWENELKRFDEEFIPLDGPSLRYCIEETNTTGEWPARYRKCIVPYSLFDEELINGKKVGTRKVRQGLLDLDPAPHFDLLIVDEAHHIKNPGTSRNRVVDFFAQNAEAAIFLTATPIELGNRDLFVLLNTLRPDLFIDYQTFERMTEPNKFINNAVVAIRKNKSNWQKEAKDYLNEAKTTTWGKGAFENNPDFIEILEKLNENNISAEERIRLITNIENLNTFSHIINRTRRRDIGNFTVRKPTTIRTLFTPEQAIFYSHLMNIENELMKTIHGGNVEFFQNMMQRQCSSCIYGMIPFLDQILARNISELLDTYYDVDEAVLQEIINQFKDSFKKLKEEAESLPTEDNKYNALIKTIREKQELKNNKIIIFSTFRKWLATESTEPYGSYGNGSAMRVSSAGWLFDTLERTREVARWTAEVTHNHPEGVKGAESVAAVTWLARTGASKEEIKEYVVREFGYDLSRTCDQIRPEYRHMESCQKTVPEAITAFLEGTGFEDVIRNAVSLGGDCDTLTDIATGMAEAFYGCPDEFKKECLDRIPEDMKRVVERFEKVRIERKGN